jgi:hypothetical protein
MFLFWSQPIGCHELLVVAKGLAFANALIHPIDHLAFSLEALRGRDLAPVLQNGAEGLLQCEEALQLSPVDLASPVAQSFCQYLVPACDRYALEYVRLRILKRLFGGSPRPRAYVTLVPQPRQLGGLLRRKPCALPGTHLLSRYLDQLLRARLAHQHRNFPIGRLATVPFHELLDGFIALTAALAVLP